MSKHQSELERIKKLTLVRLENGRHVCASEAFFPPETDEEHEEIAPFLNELPILQSDLLLGDERSNIEGFLEDLGVLALNPMDLIGKWIIPQYAQFDKPSKERNRLHVRYIFKVSDKLSGNEHRQLKEELSKVPILRAYNGVQTETFNFLKPCDVYLPKSYTGDTDLETYFSVSDGGSWFVDDAYLEDKSDVKAWFQFLKAIGAMNTPKVGKIEVVGNYEECEKRGITRQRSTRPFENGSFKDNYYSGYFDGAIVDLDFTGLLGVFAQITDHNEVNLSRAIWNLLIKAVKPLSPEKLRWSKESNRDAFFQCIYHRFYNRPQRELFDATFYRQLKETAWIPDIHGNLRKPSECFAPTDANRRVLGESVAYLHSDFDISEDNEAARWLADKLGIHLNANTDSVLNYLQTLSGTEVSVEQVEPLYRFLQRQDARRSEEFKQQPLIFTSSPEPRWWRLDQVFWEDESVVFGNRRGYLKKNYVDYEGTLEPFFTALGVLRNAALSDYLRVIREVTSMEQAEDVKVRDRVETLYRHIMPYLREGDDSLENETWKKEWDLTREGRCWLGKKGDEWGFFFLHELVWKDDDYRSGLFKDEVPFWAFDKDLLEFAKSVNVEGCCQDSSVAFDCYGDQGEDRILSEKVRRLRPYICDFLTSPLLCEKQEGNKSPEFLNRLSVRRAQRLTVNYELKGVSVSDPNPRQSFLDDRNQTLWLGFKEDEKAYPDLIGDALQDYFRFDQLREFVKDLFPSINLSETALLNWERRGFQAECCLLPLEVDSEENKENLSESVDERLLGETDGKSGSETNNSESETPTVHEYSETENENSDSTENESEVLAHRPRPGRGGARWHGGSGGSAPNRNRSTGYGGGGGGGEGEEHRTLKEYLADNPSLFGEGLKLIDTEYRFGSGDEADILFEDSSGNPVTVEVKPPISFGSDQEVWQAVKYKHLAAVEYNLPCEEIRSILAAPEIPEDVKEKCKELGIEPFEVSQE